MLLFKVTQCHDCLPRMLYSPRQSQSSFIMSKQLEPSLVKIECMSKTLLHCVTPHSNTHQLGQLVKPTSPRIWNTLWIHDSLHIWIEAIATFLIVCEAHLNILFITKVKILLLLKWSYRSPPPFQMMLTIEHRMGMFMVFVLGAHLTTYQPLIGLQLREVTC